MLSNLPYPPEKRILFLPDPLMDMIIAVAYYLPIAILLALFLIKVDIDYSLVFIAGGIYGILTEQNGAIFFSFNGIAWLYVAVVYGSYLAIPAVAGESRLKTLRRRVHPVLSTIALLLLLVINFYTLVRISMLLLLIAFHIPM